MMNHFLNIYYLLLTALIRLQELLKDPFIRQRQVIVRQFQPQQEYRKLLKELGRAGIKNIVIDVPTKSVQTVLKHVSTDTSFKLIPCTVMFLYFP